MGTSINGASINHTSSDLDEIKREEGDSSSGSFSNFLSKVKDQLKSIQDSFKNGLQYVKSKFSSSPKHESDAEYVDTQFSPQEVLGKVQMQSTEKPDDFFGTRIAIDAPEMCGADEVKSNKKCRVIYPF